LKEAQMRRQDWEQHVAAQGASGKSIKEYCREAGLPDSTFQYHARKPKEQYVQVAGREPCELHFSDGTVLRFPSTAVATVLEALLER
jgi:hypothetical protein